MSIIDYIFDKLSGKNQDSYKLISDRQAAELICSCWNKLDVSAIEKYLDEDVIWNYGTLQKEIHGKANYLKLMSNIFYSLQYSKKSYKADVIMINDHFFASITIDGKNEDMVHHLDIKDGLIKRIDIGPSPSWWDNQFDPSPYGVVSQTSFHEQATAVAAIEQYVKTEFNDKAIKWARPYDLRNSHCQLSFTCDGLSYDVLVEIHSFDESKCRFVMKSEYNRLRTGCQENGHIPCILALDSEEQFVSLTLLDDLKVTVQKIRNKGMNEWTFRRLFKSEAQLSRMVITKDHRIVLPDYNDIEIKMEPLVKAVYLLFLNHPNGIVFKELTDYREELLGIYKQLKPIGLNDHSLQSIKDVTNPLHNSINEKCARIRAAFIREFDEGLAKYYFVTGERGEVKKILLPRNLVLWEL